jgi:hypothetical protein
MQLASFRDRVGSGGGIDCHGVTFSSKFELTAWFQEKNPPVELFLDAHALMHAVRAPVVHQEEASRNLESQRKTSMTTGLQSAAISSFETILPSVLVGNMKTGSGALVPQDLFGMGTHGTQERSEQAYSGRRHVDPRPGRSTARGLALRCGRETTILRHRRGLVQLRHPARNLG